MTTNKIAIDPYLNFDGNCREAMNSYHKILDGQLEIMPFEGSPMEVPADYSQKVMHASLRFDGSTLMGSDAMPGQEVIHGNASYVSLSFTNLADAESAFNKLSERGNISMPFDDTFWGDKFGMFTDKYGISWMISCAK